MIVVWTLAVVLGAAQPPDASTDVAAPPAAETERTPAGLLARAHAYMDEVEYRLALDDLNDVIGHPEATTDQQLEAHLWAGILNRIMENDVDARLHFSWVLKRRPTFELPPGQPPKVEILFDMVRDELAPAPGGAVDFPVDPVQPAPTTSSGSGPTAPPGGAPTPSTEAGASGEPATDASVDDGGLPWVSIGGGVVAAAGLLLVVFAGASWAGGLGLFFYGQSLDEQVTAESLRLPAAVAQIAGQAGLAVAVFLVVLGAGVGVAGLFLE